MRRIKDLIFRNYWWSIGVAASIVVVLWVDGRSIRESQTLLAILGGLFSLAFFVQKQKLDELKLFRELFVGFNKKYDELNEDLARIAAEERSIVGKDLQVVVDYLNLCAEEYFWYRQGLIPEIVWTSWCKGMDIYFSKDAFASIWATECSTDSYYGLTMDVIAAGTRRQEKVKRLPPG